MNIALESKEMERVRIFLKSVQTGIGHPEDVRQKGEGGFFPGLTARPWHEPDSFPSTVSVTRVLESYADAITDEYKAATTDDSLLVPHPASNLHPSLRGRDWGFLELWRGGRFLPGIIELFPATCRALAEVAPYLSPAGQVAFHRLEPGARLRPHADGPNTTLTCHLGIDVPASCGLRVADSTRTWQDAKCLWFDHSYVHEAWNEAERARTILLLDVVHPDMTPAEVAAWRQMYQASSDRRANQ